MKSILKIVLLEPLSQDKIDELILDNGDVLVQVQRGYPCGDVPELLSLVVPASVSGGFLLELKNLIDICSFLHEQDAVVVVANYGAGVLDLTGSYLRDKADTSSLTPIVSVSYGIVFIVGGLSGIKRFAYVVSYSDKLSSAMISELGYAGLVLDPDSTGSLMEIVAAPCGGFMVEFQTPAGSVSNMVFDYDFKGKILTV